MIILSDIRVTVNGVILDYVTEVVRESGGRRKADNCQITIGSRVNGLSVGMPVLVTYDKISLDGTVGLWSCEENYHDASGYNNHGTVSGSGVVSYETGYAGRCWRFVNDDTVVTIPHSDSFDFSEQWDISMWIKPDEVSREQVIFSYLASNSDKLELFIRGGILGINVSRVTATFSLLTLQPGQWHYVRAAQVSTTKIKLWVNDTSHEISVSGWWGDTRTDADITFGSGDGLSNTGNVHYAGLMDLVRLKCGGIISELDHTHIISHDEPAEFARFGGRIQKYDSEHITNITALSYAADLHSEYVIYESTNNLDIIEMLVNLINDHTDLTATHKGLTGITLGTTHLDGKIIDIIQKYLDATGWEFVSDPFGTVKFFQSTQRQIPHGLVHGQNSNITAITYTDEYVANKVILDGGGTDTNYQDPNARTRTAVFLHRQYNPNLVNLRTADLSTVGSEALATETTLKGSVQLLGNIQSIQSVRLLYYTQTTYEGLYQTLRFWKTGSRPAAEFYHSIFRRFWPVIAEWELTSADYTFTGDRFKINNAFVWPSSAVSVGYHRIYYTTAGGDAGRPADAVNYNYLQDYNAAQSAFTNAVNRSAGNLALYQDYLNEVQIKPFLVEIKYTYFAEQGENPGPQPHQIALANKGIPTRKTIRKSIPWLPTEQDKRSYLTWYLENHHDVKPSIKAEVYTFSEIFRPGDIIHVTADYLDIDGDYIVFSAKSHYPDNITEVELGEYQGDFITTMQAISRKMQDIDTRVNNYSQTIQSVSFHTLPKPKEPTISWSDV